MAIIDPPPRRLRLKLPFVLARFLLAVIVGFRKVK
jgi:hypothetical protein